MNVLRQAEKAGVKRFVVTSSVATVAGNSNGTFKDTGMLFTCVVVLEFT